MGHNEISIVALRMQEDPKPLIRVDGSAVHVIIFVPHIW